MFPVLHFKCDRCGRRVWQDATPSLAFSSQDSDYPQKRYAPVRRAVISTSC
jgi:hypothetical protein